MATPYHIQVPSNDSGLLGVAQNDASASKVTELLQKDLEQHHVFFNADGFHNHIVHHLLTLYGVGSSADILQSAYDANASYQLKAKSPKSPVVGELQQDWAANAPKYLGLGKHYADFLAYFQAELENKDWQRVVNEFLFAGDQRSNDLFERLFAGFLHPLIQLMYGLEWGQPAIIAEGLAQTAIHDNRLGDFLRRAEQAANARTDHPEMQQPYASLFEAARDSGKLAGSASFDDPNKIYDGVMKRAPEEAVEFLSKVKVKPEELEERTAEMFHTAAWVAATASWHPPHVPKYDFFLIHHVNSAPIFLTINKLPRVPLDMKVRILEWKIRMDIVQYVARGCPPLDSAAISNYRPNDGTKLVSKPAELLPRFQKIMDDGHTIKLVRAMLLAQRISEKYKDRSWVRFVDDDMWLKAHYLLLDGTESHDTRWVRAAGFDEAWKNMPKA